MQLRKGYTLLDLKVIEVHDMVIIEKRRLYMDVIQF